jgi:hypothetical protein
MQTPRLSSRPNHSTISTSPLRAHENPNCRRYRATTWKFTGKAVCTPATRHRVSGSFMARSTRLAANTKFIELCLRGGLERSRT